MIDISSISSHLKSALLSGADDIPDGSYDEELMKQTVVPFRNGIFRPSPPGLRKLRAQQLVIAAHSGDHSIYPTAGGIMAAMTEAIRLGTYAGLGILRPSSTCPRAASPPWARFGVTFRTYSCYKGGAVHCGVCSTCMNAGKPSGKPESGSNGLCACRNSIQMPGMKR
ncbi:MAG: 7-cyano-7-deazaguanine synthase [Akkermansia sp.]